MIRPRRRPAGCLWNIVSDWTGRCDLAVAGAAELAWNAYATATRIGWWIRSAVLLGPEWWSNRGDFHRSFLPSLWRQAEYLARNIEWDLRGNHLVRDAVGLAFAGRFFDGPDANNGCVPRRTSRRVSLSSKFWTTADISNAARSIT